MTTLISARTKKQVRQFAALSLEQFRAGIDAGNPAQTPLPTLNLKMHSGLTASVPHPEYVHGPGHALALQRVIQKLQPAMYAFVVDIRSQAPKTQFGILVSAAVPDWDASIAQIYSLDAGQLRIVSTLEGDSDGERRAALTVLPNMFAPIAATLPEELRQTVETYSDDLVAQLLPQLRSSTTASLH